MSADVLSYQARALHLLAACIYLCFCQVWRKKKAAEAKKAAGKGKGGKAAAGKAAAKGKK